MHKKAQGWGIDIIAAIMIFFFGIVLFYTYSINKSNESEVNFESLKYEGNLILGSILSEGYPVEWNSTNVNKIGILSDGKINHTKLEAFYNLTLSDYSLTRRLFTTKYHYFIFVEENFTFHNGAVNIDGFGKPGFDRNNINAENLIRINRVAIYNDKPSTFNLYIWNE